MQVRRGADLNVPSDEPDVDDSLGTLTYFSTPHDTVLSALQDRAQQTRSNLAIEAGDGDSAHSPADRRQSNNGSGFMRSTPSRLSGALSPIPFTTAFPQDSATVLTDPYDGTTLGVLVPNVPFPADHLAANSQTSRENVGPSAKELPKNAELWDHLSQITDLQTEIARMHLEMEGVGTGKGKGKGKGKADDGKDKRDRKPSESGRQSQSDVGPEEYDVEGEGVEMNDEETERNRAREEEFAKLANQFEGRKDSINGIMIKLDDLSKALGEFHALQAPEMNSSSVHDTTPPSMHRTPTTASRWSKATSLAMPPSANLTRSLSRTDEQGPKSDL